MRNRLYWILILQVGVILVLFSVPITIQAGDSNSNLSAQELTELSKEIEIAERELQNMKIESEAWIEESKGLSDLWQRTPIYVSSTLWSDGEFPGKIRIDVHKEILRCEECISPYTESSYSMGFDGQEGRVAYHTTGYGSKTFNSNRGEILPGVPVRLESRFISQTCTGLAFSFHFCLLNESYTFAQLFKLANDPKSKVPSYFEFTREIFEGVKCIKITLKGEETKNWHTSWWLAPERSFALLGYEEIGRHKDGSERIVSSIKVNKLLEVFHGIWWPIEVTHKSDLSPYDSKPEERTYQKIVWRASNVVINDPKFNNGVFTIPFPKGYLIEDGINNIQYKVGKDTSILQNKIE